MHRKKSDKEFHFQNWFRECVTTAGITLTALGRNSYPDFVLPAPAEGYEIKGLAYPGREMDFDCNSQLPKGRHEERDVFYVFGRYPNWDDGTEQYPITDLIVCHGDFLNAANDSIHRNKSIRGFGSYGDILVRDRKMYVAPTPFALTEGTAGNSTLILPATTPVDDRRLAPVGELVRHEAERLLVGYSFDLRTNVLEGRFAENPQHGVAHLFRAYRLANGAGEIVRMRERTPPVTDRDSEEDA